MMHDEVFGSVVQVNAIGVNAWLWPKIVVGDLRALSVRAPGVDAAHVIGQERVIGDFIEQRPTILGTEHEEPPRPERMTVL